MTEVTNRLLQFYSYLSTVSTTSPTPKQLTARRRYAESLIDECSNMLTSHVWPSRESSEARQAATDLDAALADFSSALRNPSSDSLPESFVQEFTRAYTLISKCRHHLGLSSLPQLP